MEVVASRPQTPPPTIVSQRPDEADGVIGIISRDSYSPTSFTQNDEPVSGYRSRANTWPTPELQANEYTPPPLLSPETSLPSSAGRQGASHERSPIATTALPAVGVEGVRLGGRGMTVETAWSIELPPLPPDFSIDVELTNGLTIVIAHSRRHADGRWFVVAKDAANRRHFVARFQRQKAFSPYHAIARILGSPFTGDLTALLVLLLSTLLTFVTDDSGSGGGDAPSAAGSASQSLRRSFTRGGDATTTASAATGSSQRPLQEALLNVVAVLLGGEGGAVELTSVLRVALLAALSLAICSRLFGKLYERFPPRSEYTLSIATRAGALDHELSATGEVGSSGGWLTRGRRQGANGGVNGEEEEGERFSLMVAMTVAYQNAVCAPPAGSAKGAPNSPDGGSNGANPAASATSTPPKANGDSTAEGGGGGGGGAADAPGGGGGGMLTGELNLLVGPLLDAIQQSLAYGEVFGPLMTLAVKNDEGNLRKARKAWEKYAEDDPRRAMTLRGLLEMEKEAGIHKPGAVLFDPSAAIALLWMRRTLQFLQQCLAGVLAEEPTMNEVGANAYKMELEPFHGWLLKNTFTMALNGMPRRDEIFLRLGSHLPEESREVLLRQEVTECIQMLRQVVDSMRYLFEQLDLEDMRKV